MKTQLTIEDTRKMSDVELRIAIGEHSKKLEELGMDHVSACKFISSMMNLGISAQENWNKKYHK